MSSSLSENILKVNFSQNEKLDSLGRVTSSSITLEQWLQKIRNDLPSFGEAGRDLRDNKRDNFKFERRITANVKVQIFSDDPNQPDLIVDEITRPWNDAIDFKAMEIYNENRRKYIDQKGKIWTYLIQSVTKAFYEELDRTTINSLLTNQDIHGLLDLITDHANLGSDPRGVKTHFKLLTLKQLDKNVLTRFPTFIAKWEDVLSQLKGKHREPTDEQKAEYLAAAVWKPMFSDCISRIHRTGDYPSYNALKQELRNIDQNMDITDLNGLLNIHKVTIANENTANNSTTNGSLNVGLTAISNDLEPDRDSKRKGKKRDSNNPNGSNKKPKNSPKDGNKNSNNNNNKNNNKKKKQCQNCLKIHSGECRLPKSRCNHCHRMGHKEELCRIKASGFAPCAGCNNHNPNPNQNTTLVVPKVNNGNNDQEDLDEVTEDFIANYVNSSNDISSRILISKEATNLDVINDMDSSSNYEQEFTEIDSVTNLESSELEEFPDDKSYISNIENIDEIKESVDQLVLVTDLLHHNLTLVSKEEKYIFLDTGATKHVVINANVIPPTQNLQVLRGNDSSITGVDVNPNSTLIVKYKINHPYLGEFLVVPNSGYNLINPYLLLDFYDVHIPSNKLNPLTITHKIPANWNITASNFPKDAIVATATAKDNLYRMTIQSFKSSFNKDPMIERSKIIWPPEGPTYTSNDTLVATVDIIQPTTKTPKLTPQVEVSTNYSTEQIKRAKRIRYLHCVLGHPSNGVLKRALQFGAITGTKFTTKDIELTELILGQCSHCIRGKSTALSYKPSDSTPSSKPGEVVHVDIMALPELSIGGKRFILFTVDDFSGYISLVGLVNKDTKILCSAVDSLIATYSQYKIIIHKLVSDFESNLSSCKQYINLKGIQFGQTPPYQHAQKCERYVRTIKERMRTILSSLSYHLPAALYYELITAAVFYLNSLPNSLHPQSSPKEIIEGTKLDISNIPLLPFGQPALFDESKRHQGSYVPHADYGICLGPHNTCPNSIRAYIFETGIVEVRRKVTPLIELPPNVKWKQHPIDPRLKVEFHTRIHNRPNMEVFADLLNYNDVTNINSTNTKISRQTNPSSVIPSRFQNVNNIGSEVSVPSTSAIATSPRNVAIDKESSNGDTTNRSIRRKISNDSEINSASESTSSNSSALETQISKPQVINTSNIETTNTNDVYLPNSNHTSADQDLQGETNNNNSIDRTTIDSSNDRIVINNSTDNSFNSMQASSKPTTVDPDAPSNADITTFSSQLHDLSNDIPNFNTDHDDDHITVEEEIRHHHYNTRHKHKATKINFALRISVKSAINGPRKEEAIEAISSEIKTLLDAKVGHYVKIKDIPKDLRRNILPSFTFIKYKVHADGSFDRVKARHVAGGHLQTDLDDMYTDISSTTVNITSVMLLLNIYTLTAGKLVTYDIKGAFLNAPWDKKDPKTYIRIDKHMTKVWTMIDKSAKQYLTGDGELIVELDKYIYGLKQSPLMWQMHLLNTLKRLGFTRLINDDCLYIYKRNNHFTLIAIHVDDILQMSTSMDLIQLLHDGLAETYHGLVYNKEPKSYLGMNLTTQSDNKSIEIDMTASINKLIDKHLPKPYKLYNSPGGSDLFDAKDSTPLPNKNNYLSIVMSLMYIARLVRPDILLSVVYLSTRSSQPTENDYSKLMRVLSYLKMTSHIKLKLQCDNLTINCHCDASYGAHHDGASHTGYWVSLGKTRSYLYAKSNKQKLFATSSTEAELVAAVDSVKTLIWIQNLINEIGIINVPFSRLYQDNKSVIFLITDISKHRRSKHLLIKLNYIKQIYDSGIIKVIYIPTDKMVADTLTKSLQGALFLNLNCSILGIKVIDLRH